MATAAGVRFAVAKLPTPGSGLDDEDRYALGGTVLSANSVPIPAWDVPAGVRFSVAKIPTPNSGLDAQDRFAIAGMTLPTTDATPGEFFETFTLTYTLTPTSEGAQAPGSFDGAITGLISSFISSLSGSSLDPALSWSEAAMMSAIVNDDATTDVPVNYEICDRTGFKQSVKSGLLQDAYGGYMRGDSIDPRHPQDMIGNKAESLTGPLRPEAPDVFIETEVTPDDL